MSRTQGQGLHSGVFKGQLLAQWEQDMGCLGQLFHLCNRDAWHENSQVSLPVSSNSCQGEGGKEGQVGQGLEQAGPVEGVFVSGRGWNGMGFKVPSEPNPSGIPWL